MSRQSTKNKKYALRKIGKVFGSCAVATIISLGGAAIMAPTVTVHASDNNSGGGTDTDIHEISHPDNGYEVIIPKGKKYIRNDEKDNQTPELIDPGYNGRSFIVPSETHDPYDDMSKLSKLFNTLYDKDGDGEIDEKYKDPKYPHVVDSGLTSDAEGSNNKPGVWEYRPDGKYEESDGVIDESDSIVVARKPFTIDANAEDNVVNDDGSVVLNGGYKIHVNDGDHIDKKDDVYEVGTKPKVERTPIPFETTYKRDDSVPEGTEEEVTAGKNGETVKTTTYELNPTTGEVTANEPTSVTTNPVTRVVKKGTQPKVEKTPIPFETTYERDDSVPEGTEEEVTAGKNGETVKTTTYELNPTTGEVTANEPTSVTTNAVTRVVKKGTQPKVEKTPIPFETTYERDDSVPEGTEEEVTAGKNGETVKTTTYELNPTTGEVTANEPTTATTDPVTRVVKRGTQPTVERTPIPFETTYERDDSIPKGEEREVTAGVNGEKVTTTTYEVNPKTGDVTANTPTSETTNPVTRVVKRGTQPTVERTPIPFETTYERDDSIPKGEEREVTAGVNGEKVTTTTYEVNPKTGDVTANTPTSETTNPTTRVVKRGTQPTVERTPIPFETTYERDDSIPKGEEREVTAGKNGETVKTTTYELNPTTGEVTANEPTSVTTNAVTRVVKKGTQPKVEKTPIPFETTYELDNSIPEGEEREVTAGVNGETVKTTTYELNPTTGEVTANEPTSVTTNPVTRVVKRGTQPKPGETPETPKPEKPGETPETPQPKPGQPTTPYGAPTQPVQPDKPTKPEGTPETPQPKPGDTPETPKPKPGQPTTPYGAPTQPVQPGNPTKPDGTPVQPAQPGEPTKPDGTPVQPAQPGEPTKPDGTPVQPAQPGEPTKPDGTPVQPAQPGEPTKPDGTPVQPAQPGEPTKPDGTPVQPAQPGEPTKPDGIPVKPEDALNVLPPTPRIVERSGGNTVEVSVPNKDADTLSITFTKRNSTEKETIVTKKDEDGKWMIEKAPKGVTINPTNGLVYIPSKQVQPKTWVDTQTKHKNKQSKIVSVMPNILEVPEFVGATEWIDVNGEVLKPLEKGVHEKEKFDNYVWLESILEGDKITHIYFEGTPSVEKPEYKVTVWFDKDGNPIKPDQPGTYEAGNIPGYRLIMTTTKDGITTHIFEKVANGSPILPERPTSHPKTPSSSPSTSTPEKPNKAQTPSPEQAASPAPSKVSEQKGEAVATATSEKTVDSATSTKTSDKAELPNTGTEANASLASAGIMTLLAGLGLGFFKKKEDEK